MYTNKNFRPKPYCILATMDPNTLIESATIRLKILQAADYTPQAELTALELQLSIAQSVLAIAEYIAPLQLQKGK
jgi:hypothetical protein